MMSMWRSALLLATGLGLIACGETLPSPDTHICTEEEQALSTLRALQPLENGIRAALYPSRPRYPATQLVDITIDLATAWGEPLVGRILVATALAWPRSLSTMARPPRSAAMSPSARWRPRPRGSG